jgi:RimJ/RimL family protein N-acetyltransferase
MDTMPSADLLASWTSIARTRNGVDIRIRPLRPDDRPREADFINSLSERTRYLRLLTPLRFLPPHLLDQLMDVDYHRRMALVATVESDSAERFIGIARYGEADKPDTAEIAITVADAWHRCGVATLLLTELLRFARWRGYRRAIGMVLLDNYPMLALARSLEFTATLHPSEHLMWISRDL